MGGTLDLMYLDRSVPCKINWHRNSVFPRGEKASIEIVRCSGRRRTMDGHQMVKKGKGRRGSRSPDFGFRYGVPYVCVDLALYGINTLIRFTVH